MRKIIFVIIVAALLSACSNEEEINVEKTHLTLTIGASERIVVTELEEASDKRVTWTSSNPDAVSVDEDGVVTAVGFTIGGTSTVPAEATGKAVITVTTEDGSFIASYIVATTMAGQTEMRDLPPLKNAFAEYFMLGNIFDPYQVSNDSKITDTRLTHHYNILTHQNNMKPMYLSGATAGTYNQNNLNTAMRMINAAHTANIKVVGHTLLWHGQISKWMEELRTNSVGKDEALTLMKEWITYIVNFYKGKIYSWDVLNEIMDNYQSPGITSNWKNFMRALKYNDKGESEGNPWFIKIGADFVFEAYKAARLADPIPLLYYNDFQLNSQDYGGWNTIGRAQMVHNMVRDVNQKWTTDPDYDNRLLIEGIGMQSHHSIGTTAESEKRSLDLFRQLGVKISISELDLGSRNDDNPINNNGRLEQAKRYYELFKVYLENSDIIERVSFWGLADDNSWVGDSDPLLFERDSDGVRGAPYTNLAKPAYYFVVKALRDYEIEN